MGYNLLSSHGFISESPSVTWVAVPPLSSHSSIRCVVCRAIPFPYLTPRDPYLSAEPAAILLPSGDQEHLRRFWNEKKLHEQLMCKTSAFILWAVTPSPLNSYFFITFFFKGKVLLCSPGWSGTSCVDQTTLNWKRSAYLLFHLFFFYVYGHFTSIHVCVPWVCSARRGD